MTEARAGNRSPIGVIDIFAGPGGLGEGFSSFQTGIDAGEHPFELAVSAEMEKSAHSTLQLRAFYRLAIRQLGIVPQEYWEYTHNLAAGHTLTPKEYFSSTGLASLWREAEAEALNLTLGNEDHNRALRDRITNVRDSYDEIVLVGGPPCQAYSLVGRARQKNVRGFKTKGDPRHFLYRQYLEILGRFRPAVFIMENVKGILTSTVGNQEMFSAIMRDLADPNAALGHHVAGSARERYVLLPIHVPEGCERTHELVERDPAAFIIRSEMHGIPQARHRVIVMGVREDVMSPAVARIPGFQICSSPETIQHALAGLPALRSGLSRKPDDEREWLAAVDQQRRLVMGATQRSLPRVEHVLAGVEFRAGLRRSSTKYSPGRVSALAGKLRGESRVVLNHEARGHMASDLARYLFCAAFAESEGRSPVKRDFPRSKVLKPDHKNWETGAFADRFRVQVAGQPSSTITSHLSKDGHAFIHWDMTQCRSLTVREAARLQTFPDDYVFLGNRTQQFVQVGNAVPPALARQIARVVHNVLSGTQ